MMDERLNWLLLAADFALDGDSSGMRSCAREIYELNPLLADGPALMAEAALYAGNLEEADMLAHDALDLNPHHLLSKLVLAGVAGQRFHMQEAISLFKEAVASVQERLEHIERLRRELDVRSRALGIMEDEKDLRTNMEAEEKICKRMLLLANGWMADSFYLAGDPKEAAIAMKKASSYAEKTEQAAALYSKYLFLLNYRLLPLERSKMEAMHYAKIWKGIKPYVHENTPRHPDKRLRVGYISPDFRTHAVANFVAPFLRDFNDKEFSVYCYSRGNKDMVTQQLQRFPVAWRDIRGRSPRAAARMIFEDQIDILVDLSGHSQDNCLDIMVYRPAPVQVSGIGYTNTTGLSVVDYVLSDEICMPKGVQAGFTEKILRLSGCHLCYAPEVLREMPATSEMAPCVETGVVTFGCFNNFSKVTDEMLRLWRSVMEQVQDSKLVIKNKICSVPSGLQIVRDRLRKAGLPMARVDLRPYSPDYLEQYREIDIALDTAPYNGGLTTCEALFMGVPVVTMRGSSHGSRFGASILANAGLEELVADSPSEYSKRMVRLATNAKLVQDYRKGLRNHLQHSRLMDSKGYMADLEERYREIWQAYCRG